MKTEPTICEKFADNGEHSHWELINTDTGETLWKEGQSNSKIKQLEWEDTDMWYFKAKPSLGLGYSITEIKGTYIVHFGDAPISWEKSLESAKSAAQEHFEQRVKECLE